MNQIPGTRLSYLFLLCFFWAGVAPLSGQSNCDITGNTMPCQNSEAEYLLTHNVPAPFKVDWQVFGGSIITESSTALTVGWSAPGVQQIYATVTQLGGGVIATCNLSVTVLSAPVIEPLADIVSCTGEIVQVSTTNCSGCTYNWTTQGPLSITPVDQYSANLAIGGSGSYCVEVTSADGCVNSACGTVEMPPTEILPVTVTGAVATGPNHWEVCPNQPIAFSVDAPKGMNWVIMEIGGNGNSWVLTGTDISFSFPTPGVTDYVVTATQTDGRFEGITCLAIEPQYIHVALSPPVPIFCPSVVCEGDEITYTVQEVGCSDGSMPWWEVSGQGAIVGTPTSTSVTVIWSYDPENPNGYVIYNGNCSGFCSGPSIVEVPIVPSQGEINGPDGICFPNATLTWSATNYVGGVYNWSYSPSPNANVTQLPTANPNEYKLKFGPGFQGSITIRLEFSHPFANCGFIAEKVIELAPLTGEILGPTTICATDVDEDQTYTFNHNGNLSWTFYNISLLGAPILEGNSSTNPHNFLIPANTMEPGNTYALTLTSDQGCTKALFISVLPPLTGEIVGPTTVCPDVDYHYTVFPPPVAGETFIWSIVRNGTTPITVFSPAIDINWPAGTGSTLSVIRRSSEGCELHIGPINITVLTGNEPLVIEGPANTCPDIIQTYSVPAVTGASYVWTITNPDGSPSNIGSIFSGQGSPVIEVQWLGVSSQTVVHLNVSAEYCGVQTNATLEITINPFELILATPDICEGQDGILVTTGVNSADGYSVYLDGVAIYTNSPTLDPIPANYLGAGTHIVLLEVLNPNGCAGPVSTTSTLVVHPNPAIKISLSDLLPCPKNTPFIRELTVSPSSPGCSYQWFLNNVPFGPNAPLVQINQEGIYRVLVQCGDCPPRSAIFEIEYECEECCEQDVEGNDIVVQMTACSLSVNQCNLIEFSGTITPFQLAHNPRWTIEKPGGEFIDIPIDPAGVIGNFVEGSYQANEVGIYRVYLSADELWRDIYIIVNLHHGLYLYFADYCEFEAAGGAAMYPNYQVFKTNLPAYCTRSDYRNIQVRFIANFTSQVLCNADGTFQIVANDISLYDTGVSSTIEWTFPGGSQSGPALNIPSVPALTNVEVCMNVTDQTGYTCKDCKIISTPAQVIPGIDVASQNLCQFQNFQFSPLIYPASSTGNVVSYFWVFGDGSFSYTDAPFKVYTTPGTYIVELTVETLSGCFLTTSVTVIVNDNSLPEGVIDITPGNCNSSAVLTFNQSSGPPVVDYLWSPANDNLPSITVFSSGTYGLEVTGSNGCSNVIDPVVLSLEEPFPFEVYVNEYCGGFSMNFSGNPAYNYEWTWSPSTPGISQPVSGTSLFLPDIQPGIYQVTITAFQGGVPCKTKVVSVTVRPVMIAPQVVQSTTCENGQMWVQLTATNVPADAEVTWNGPGLNVSGPSSILVNKNGTYTVRYTSSLGCSNSIFVPVANIINFSTFLSGCYDCSILENGPLYLQGIPGSFDSWYWEINGVSQGAQSGAITPLLLLPTYQKIRLCITQNGCMLCSPEFCLIGDCNEEPCRIPVPTIRRVQCLDESNPAAPGMTRYFVHWDFPTDGIVEPCLGGDVPDIYVAGNPNPVGQFESGNFTFEEISGFWHFEGVFLLDAAYSPAQACWGIPFCLISTGAICDTAQVCPVDYPNYDPYYSCTNPNGPFDECDDMVITLVDVVCEDNPNTSITHLVTVHIEATAPVTTCGQFAIQITSITGDLLYPISGQLYNLTGPTISTDVVLGWASNTANDILCLEVDLREDFDCWPLTYLDDPSTPNVNEAGKICLKRECFNLVESDCPDHEYEVENYFGFTATCIPERSINGQAVYGIVITTPFLINQLSFSLTPLSGTIQNFNFIGTNMIRFEYVTVPGNLLFFATMTNNGNTYYIQELLEDCGFLGNGGGPGKERGIDANQTDPNHLELYPNPTNGLLNIRYGLAANASQSVRIDIYDLNGRQLRHFESDEAYGNWITNVRDWNPGFYLVVLRDASGKIFESQKLIVEAR